MLEQPIDKNPSGAFDQETAAPVPKRHGISKTIGEVNSVMGRTNGSPRPVSGLASNLKLQQQAKPARENSQREEANLKKITSCLELNRFNSFKLINFYGSCTVKTVDKYINHSEQTKEHPDSNQTDSKKTDLNPMSSRGFLIAEDWDLFENMLDYIYKKSLDSQSCLNSEAELMFLVLVKNDVLAAYANGRSTGLVFDSGASQTSAIPVHDGYVIQQAIVKSPLGGDFITMQCQKYFDEQKVEIIPPYMIAGKEQVNENQAVKWTKKSNLPEVNKFWHNYMVREVLDDRQTIALQINKQPYDRNKVEIMPTFHYEFPNGYNKDFGGERFLIPECLLFEPSNVKDKLSGVVLDMRQIATSVGVNEIDIRPQLYGNLIITGGNTLIQGFNDRLYKELSNKTLPKIEPVLPEASPANPNEINIHLNTPNGWRTTVVSPLITGYGLKKLIRSMLDYPQKEQRLFVEGRLLSDEGTLAAQKVRNHQVICVNLPLRGGLQPDQLSAMLNVENWKNCSPTFVSAFIVAGLFWMVVHLKNAECSITDPEKNFDRTFFNDRCTDSMPSLRLYQNQPTFFMIYTLLFVAPSLLTAICTENRQVRKLIALISALLQVPVLGATQGWPVLWLLVNGVATQLYPTLVDCQFNLTSWAGSERTKFGVCTLSTNSNISWIMYTLYAVIAASIVVTLTCFLRSLRIGKTIKKTGPKVQLSEVIGQSAAIQVIEEAVVWPMKRPDLFKGILKNSWSGVLLFGPPGNGKTLLAKAVAHQIDRPFMVLKPDDVLDPFVGVSEGRFKNLLDKAKRIRAILFLDECESFCGVRDGGVHGAQAHKNLQNALLQYMDGFTHTQDVLVIGSTNLPWQLDDAFIRRFERRIHVGLPDLQARHDLFRHFLRDNQHELTENDLHQLATMTKGYTGADIRLIVRDACLRPVRRVIQMLGIYMPVTLSDLLAAKRRTPSSSNQIALDKLASWNSRFGVKQQEDLVEVISTSGLTRRSA